MLSLILLVFVLVLFLLAAFQNLPSYPGGRLVCFGLACLAGAEIAVRAAPLLAR